MSFYIENDKVVYREEYRKRCGRLNPCSGQWDAGYYERTTGKDIWDARREAAREEIVRARFGD